MARRALLLLAAALLAGPAVAQGAGEIPWTPVGGQGRINGFFPERAVRHKVNGEAAFDCRLADGGKLAACMLVTMQPSNYGLDQTGARTLQNITVDADAGLASGAAIRATLTFKTDGRRYQIAPVLRVLNPQG